MRALVALTLVTAIQCCGTQSAIADDPVLSPPFPSTMNPVPGDFEVLPSDPQDMQSFETYPPAEPAYQPPSSPSQAYDSMPRPSYEEVASGYPAPAHSLVPSALYGGPMFVGSGSYGGSYAWGTHIRYPYYNYRSPWTYGGPASINHTIIW
ncbi:MAG: hypothetical protein KDA86_01890 [Planctomycetaceae bacterium]|nr:hypothetical protein [Planctomycetaceae bacterium]